VADGWREPFEVALDADPANQAVRRDLADHLEEVGDPDCEPMRWLADHGLVPFLSPDPNTHGMPWEWWDGGVEPFARRSGVPDSCRLPEAVYKRLTQDGDYLTRREAEADSCRAFRLASEEGWHHTAE
jgi:hypothetical protein